MASKTKADPTGQRVNRNRTTKRLSARIEKARREVMALFRKIPKSRRQVTKIINRDVQVVYDYDITPEQVEIFNAEIRRIIDMLLLETQADIMPINWWYKPEIELPVRQGTLEEVSTFNRLIAIAISLGLTGRGGMVPQKISPEAVLSSPQYLTELRNVYVENFQVIKNLSSRTSGQVIQTVNSGMQAGFTPSKIAKDINERFNVSKSSAKRIAETEVNKAYTDAKLRATDVAGEMTGLRTAVRHISALLPGRTRASHAARHFLVYTTDQQKSWWNTGTNRINCKCTVRTVLVDKTGDVIAA